MTDNQDNQSEQFFEPPSLADHQILLHSARRILNKARKFKRRKNQGIKAKRFEYGNEIVLAPRLGGKPIKVIKLPTKLSPKAIGEHSSETNTPTTIITNDPLSHIDPLPITTKMIGKQGQTVNLNVGDRKIFVRPVIKPKSPIVSPTKSPQTDQNESEGNNEEAKLIPAIKEPIHKVFLRPVLLQKTHPTEEPKVLPKNIKLVKINNFQAKRRMPKVIARGRISRKRSKPSESSDDGEIPITTPKTINPENFPKAIVYPEAPKEKPPLIIKSVESKSPFTFNHVFEEIAMKPSKDVGPSFAKTLRNTVQAIDRGMSKSTPKEPEMDEIRELIGISEDIEDENKLIIDEEDDFEVEDQFVAVVEGKRKSNFLSPKKSSENEHVPLDDSDEQFEVVVEKDVNTNDVDMGIDHDLTSNTSIKNTTIEKEVNVVEMPLKSEITTMKIGNVTVSKFRPSSSKSINNHNDVTKMSDSDTSKYHFKTFVTSFGKPVRIPILRNTQPAVTSHENTEPSKKSMNTSQKVINPEDLETSQNIHTSKYQEQPKNVQALQNSIITIDSDEESSDEEQFEIISNNLAHDNISDDDFEMPPRPEINTNLMELLSNYRIFARYLMLKKKMQPFNFDSVDSSYINAYKSLKK